VTVAKPQLLALFHLIISGKIFTPRSSKLTTSCAAAVSITLVQMLALPDTPSSSVHLCLTGVFLGVSVTWYLNRSYCAPIVHIWVTCLIAVGLFVPMPRTRGSAMYLTNFPLIALSPIDYPSSQAKSNTSPLTPCLRLPPRLPPLRVFTPFSAML
jgi:hypothetical protein